MNGTLRLLAGPGGLTGGPFPAALGTTLGVGDTEPVAIVLDKRLPAGPWDARITLRSGLLTRSESSDHVSAAGESRPVATDSRRPGWTYAAIAALLVLVLTLATLLVRRGRPRGRRSDDGGFDELELVTSPRAPSRVNQGPS
jgi:hypothetical protein